MSCVLVGDDGDGRDICVHRKSFVLLKTFVCLATRLRSSKKNTMLQKSEDIGTEKERERKRGRRPRKRKIHYYYCCRFFSPLFMENGSSKEEKRRRKEFS